MEKEQNPETSNTLFDMSQLKGITGLKITFPSKEQAA
jgi:hypothetical protein